MSRRSPTSCANARPSAARSPCSSVNSMRMKNSPPSGSVECWSEVMMLAPEAARKPATAATMPWRAGQGMSRRPFTRRAASRSVALLELLARAAPARVVAPERRVLVDAALLDDRLVVAGRLAGLAVGARLVLGRPARVGERAQAGAAAVGLRARLPRGLHGRAPFVLRALDLD